MTKLVPMKKPMKLSLSEEDKLTLERWVKSRAAGSKQTQHAKIILMTAAGLPTAEIMDKLQLSNPMLNLWRKRYVELGLPGLVKGKSRTPGIPRLESAKVQEILTLTLTGKPKDEFPNSF
ncbi:MAG: helix-turn-helix domain-containing protein [Limisphaerales bacterium]